MSHQNPDGSVTTRSVPGWLAGWEHAGVTTSREIGPAVTYQVTINGVVDSEHPSGHEADLAARKTFTSKRARGKVVAVRRSDGKVPYTSAPDFS